MPKRKTHEKFIKELKEIQPNISVLSMYTTANNKVRCKCLSCGNIWDARAAHLLNNHGCPKCSQKIKNTHESFINKMKNINNDIEIIGKYNGIKNKILCKCKIDGFEWMGRPDTLLSGACCPKCISLKKRILHTKKNDDFLEELKNINKNIIPLEEYIANDVKILCKCLTCGEQWYVRPNSLLHNHGCPNCQISNGEKRIKDFLSNHNIMYKQQMKYGDLVGVGYGMLSYDFYLPDYNILIEYQGEFHDGTARQQTIEQFTTQQEHDRRKRQYAQDHNIKLLEIWYWDFDNIEQILDKELGLSA